MTARSAEHLSAEWLSAYLDGQVTPAEQQVIEAHLLCEKSRSNLPGRASHGSSPTFRGQQPWLHFSWWSW